MKWLEIYQDNLHVKFSALNVDFSSPSSDPLDSKRPAHTGVKRGTLLKRVYLSWCRLFLVTTFSETLSSDKNNV